MPKFTNTVWFFNTLKKNCIYALVTNKSPNLVWKCGILFITSAIFNIFEVEKLFGILLIVHQNEVQDNEKHT